MCRENKPDWLSEQKIILAAPLILVATALCIFDLTVGSVFRKVKEF